MNKSEIDRFVEAGAFAAEMARSVLLGTPIAKTNAWQRTTTADEQAKMTQGMKLAAMRERLAAEACAREERERIQFEQMTADAKSAVEVFDWL